MAEDLQKWQLLIEHEERCWTAECENAERLVTRMKLMGSIAAIIFGIGLFRFEWFYRHDDVSRIQIDWVVWFIRVMLVLALFFMSVALWLMLGVQRRRRKMNASWNLFLSPRVLGRPPDSEECAMIVIARIRRASLSLLARNARLDQRLRVSIRWFFMGLAAIFLSMSAYMLFSVPPIPSRTPNDHRGNSTSQPGEAEGRVQQQGQGSGASS